MSLLNIAIVDSSRYYRNLIVKTLEGNNFNIVGAAESFEKIAEIFNSNVVNLVILDMLVPDVSGIEIARFISDKKQEVLVIMMSLLEGDDFIIDSIKVGAIDYLKKPFCEVELLKSVRKAEQRVGKL